MAAHEAPLELRRLRRAELPSDTVALARALLGVVIVSESPEGPTAARIVETEAYLPDDAAAHSFGGRTKRNDSLFLRRGHAYVYFIYGSCFCLNVSSEAAGVGAGVLLRAGQPLFGVDVMRLRRPRSAVRDLCRGPGRLAAALGVTRLDDGLDLCAPGRLRLALAGEGDPAADSQTRAGSSIGASPRIGISKEAHRLLRFYERGSPYVSGPRKLNA